MTDFLDHETESTVKEQFTVLDTVKTDPKKQTKISHFENFLQGIEKTDRTKITSKNTK